jgi:hypothetical protein
LGEGISYLNQNRGDKEKMINEFVAILKQYPPPKIVSLKIQTENLPLRRFYTNMTAKRHYLTGRYQIISKYFFYSQVQTDDFMGLLKNRRQ